MLYWIAHFLTLVLDKIFFTCKFSGLENLPLQGSYIIASNHNSNIDPFILAISQKRKFSYVAKETLFRNKFASFVMHRLSAFPIKRDSSDFRAIRETLKRLRNGCPVILFPEGTRLAKGKPKQAQRGVGLIAVKAKVPVIPVYINGSDKVLAPGAKWFKRYPITVTFGKSMIFSREQSYSDIANQIMREIYTLSDLNLKPLT